MLHRAHRLHATHDEAPPADGQEAAAALVLAEHPNGVRVHRGDRPLEVVLTGGLKGGDGLRLILCDWGAAL
jgi:hypothetical protein